MRRRPAEADGELRQPGEPGREKGGEDVPEDGELTLDVWVLVAVKKEVGDGGNQLGGQRPEQRETRRR